MRHRSASVATSLAVVVACVAGSVSTQSVNASNRSDFGAGLRSPDAPNPTSPPWPECRETQRILIKAKLKMQFLIELHRQRCDEAMVAFADAALGMRDSRECLFLFELIEASAHAPLNTIFDGPVAADVWAGIEEIRDRAIVDWVYSSCYNGDIREVRQWMNVYEDDAFWSLNGNCSQAQRSMRRIADVIKPQLPTCLRPTADRPRL